MSTKSLNCVKRHIDRERDGAEHVQSITLPLLWYFNTLKTIVKTAHLFHMCCFNQKLLFEKGKESLESEFRSLMTRNSKPVPPILILDLISLDEEIETQEDVTLDHLPENILQDIIRISGWLVEYGRNQGELPKGFVSSPTITLIQGWVTQVASGS